ncbi:MAG TPA: PAS domain S-box protein, partial [Candidatus Saccharimonadales bacterium]|nr:PAS domain S-box protein [Candidatus Saccharimonadales bacterium]
PLSDWPQTLKTSVNIALNADIPIVMLWGKDGILIYNDAYAGFAGGRHPEILGAKAVDAWPEVADFNRRVIKEGLAGRTLSFHDQELTLNRGRGPEQVWMNLNYSPINDEDGDNAGIFAVVIETTELIQAEKKQREAEAIARSEREKLDYIFDFSPAYIALLTGPKHVYTFANHQYKKLVGGRDIIGKPVAKALKELVGTGIIEMLDQVYLTGEPYIGNEMEIDIDRTGTGKVQPGIFNFVFQPIKSNGQEISGIYIHAVEVTEQVKARKEIAESKRMFDALFDSNVVAIAIADTKGNILESNRTFLRLFGYTRNDLKKGLTSVMLNTPESNAATHLIYESLAETGEAEPTERRYKRKDGTEFPGLVGAAMIPESKDKFITFILDLSEIERLKEVNKAKDEFVAIASHQLRTPATSVKQYLGVLIDELVGPLSPRQLDYLKTANEANERQLNIINDLLKTAQIDTGGYKLSIKRTDMGKLVSKVLAQHSQVLESRKQTFDFEPPQGLYARIDPSEVSVCIANIIENASKYSPEGTKIKLKLESAGRKIKLTIKDQGVGIAKEDQDKIFDKFTRIKNDMSDTVSGNGLGLYWVKRIVDLHQGSISLNSQIGKGTSFILQLPA